MRKGFTIVEMLIVIMVLPFVMIVLDGLFRTLIKDIPRSHRIVQENTSLLSMLDQMQKDIGKAKGLPESFDGHTTNDEMLLIELADSVICYQLKDEKIIRRTLKDSQQSNALEQSSWPAPHAKVQWKVWRKDKNGYAVDVKTYVEHKVRGGHLQEKMANSHLYFVDAF